jgi:regulatory protein
MTLEERARRYCASQERSPQQVREKLYSWGLNTDETERVLSVLMKEGFLNEERYARSFVDSRFRIHKWGREKIEAALKQKNIAEASIRQALQMISEDDELKNGTETARKYIARLKTADSRQKRNRTLRFLLSRGYSEEMACQIVNDLFGNE